MTRQQMTNFIGAGTIAALMLIFALAFGGWNDSTANADTNTSGNVAGEVMVMPDSELQAENAQLKETVQLLLDREAQFTEQINIANEQLAANSGGYSEGAEAENELEEPEEEEGEEEEDD